jgi:hypothetical protein
MIAAAVVAGRTVAEVPVETALGVELEEHVRTGDLDITDRDRSEENRKEIDLARQPIHRHHVRIVAPVGVGEGDVGGDDAGRETDFRPEFSVDSQLTADGIGRQSRHRVPPAAEVGEVEIEQDDHEQQ